MATFLITGGAGFPGSHIADALLARGDRVRGFLNLSTGKPAPRDGHIRNSLADIFAARHAFGYNVRVPFAEGLARAVNWYRHQRQHAQS